MDVSWHSWLGFIGMIGLFLALDLGIFHRRPHAVSIREATRWTVIWVALAALFAGWLWHRFGPSVGLQFVTGYLIEKSLSIDNIFVFVLLFSGFKIPPQYQHRVLFWGIFGALALRGLMIALGAYALAKLHWILYVFGGVLVISGLKMLKDSAPFAIEHNRPLQWLVRKLPLTSRLHGQRFWVLEGGKVVATPLFLVLLLVESADVVFAIDSIPAIFAITQEPFLVFTANAFAILGLRSMYFLLAGVIHRFRYLRFGLAAILVFVGVKMLLLDAYPIPTAVSLLVVTALLGTAIVASVLELRRSATVQPDQPPVDALPGTGEHAATPRDPAAETR